MRWTWMRFRLFARNTREDSEEGKCGIEKNQGIHDDVSLVLAPDENLDEPRSGKRRPQAAENGKDVADNAPTSDMEKQIGLCRDNQADTGEKDDGNDGVSKDACDRAQRDSSGRVVEQSDEEVASVHAKQAPVHQKAASEEESVCVAELHATALRLSPNGRKRQGGAEERSGSRKGWGPSSPRPGRARCQFLHVDSEQPKSCCKCG